MELEQLDCEALGHAGLRRHHHAAQNGSRDLATNALERRAKHGRLLEHRILCVAQVSNKRQPLPFGYRCRIHRGRILGHAGCVVRRRVAPAPLAEIIT